MSICTFCKNDSFRNGTCENCGMVLGSFQVALLKSIGYFKMTVTDKYLVFHDSLNLVGNSVAAAAGGMVGSAIFEAVKKKSAENKIGMIDLNTVEKVDIISPSSKVQGGVLHFFFHNGTDLILGVFETGMKKIELPKVIDALRAAGCPIEIQEVKSIPRMKMTNPLAKKSKQLLVSVSHSATVFIKPFKEMILID